ncbi:MAG: hypothetical protein QOK02_1472 [Mycobacterium sp.]|jgi:hypothetical protein|nr:hypothetical protein [Mycobacterium sp.]
MGAHPDFGEGGLVTDADVIAPIDELLPTVPTTTDEALVMFDGAEPIEPDFMIGTWRGAELPTGHPLDGLLPASGWWGKQFVDPETVHPLLFRAGATRWAMNPGLVPMRPALTVAMPARIAPLLRWGVAALRPVLQTRKARARLRATSYRGVVTAAMVYDQIPVIDVFRRISDDAVIGAMDLRGSPVPYFFVLQRAAAK